MQQNRQTMSTSELRAKKVQNIKQKTLESRAVARNPRDTAAVLFCLKFAKPREYPHKPYIARVKNHWATSSSLIV